MTQWSGEKVKSSQINGGEEYKLDSVVTLNDFNAVVNNSLYASQVSENISEQLSNLDPNEKIEFKGSNPNLLINSNFIINQKGQSSYNISAYTVDGWKLYQGANACIVTPNANGGISVNNGAGTSFATFRQYLTKYEVLASKTITISCNVKSVTGNIQIYCEGVKSAIQYSDRLKTGINTLTITCDSTLAQVQVGLNLSAGASVELEYLKLEFGIIATAYSPKSYEEELADCQVIEGGVATTYSNPNLLINGDFRVNQRLQPSYNGNCYTVDRWFAGANQTITVNTDGTITQTKTLNHTNRWVVQWIEDYKKLLGKTITISMKVRDAKKGVLYKLGVFDGTTITGYDKPYLYDGEQIVIDTIDIPTTDTGKLGVIFYSYQDFIGTAGSNTSVSVTIEYVKAELGSIATPFSPRPYGEELALCQRYYQKLSLQGCVGAVDGGGTNMVLFCPTPVSLGDKCSIESYVKPQLRGQGTANANTVISDIIINGKQDNGIELALTTSGLTKQVPYIAYYGSVTIDAEI